MNEVPKYPTLKQLCELICCTPIEIERMVNVGDLPPHMTNGRWNWKKVEAKLNGDREKPPAILTGFVYFAGVPNFIKIGYSAEPRVRLADLATALPFELVLLHQVRGNHETEVRLHRKFEHLWVRGEWYRRERELLEYIDTLKVDVSENSTA